MRERRRERVPVQEQHRTVLRSILSAEPVERPALAGLTDHPHYRVNYSLAVLEDAGFVATTKRGYVVTPSGRDLLDDA